jgi:hypothetical protein
VDAVYYLAASKVDAAVGRAVRETRAEDRIQVLGLGDVGEVVAREGEGDEPSVSPPPPPDTPSSVRDTELGSTSGPAHVERHQGSRFMLP